MNEALISVIIPVYNGEKTVKRSINSLLNQSYKNIEIIVINDGSTDGTEDILKEYSSKDPRIKPYYKENGGVSTARNLGLAKASGEYIMFLDSDDEIDKDTLKILEEKLSSGFDFVHCGMKKVTPEGKELKFNYKLKDKVYEENFDILCDFFRKNIMSTSCAKLYRKSLIKDLSFNKDFAVGEDELFSYNVCKNSNKAIVISNDLYSYIENEESVMNQNFTEKHFQVLSVMDIQLEDVKENKELYKLASICDCIRCNELMWKIFYTKKMYEKFPLLRKRMIKNKKYYLSAEGVSIKEKALFMLLWLMPKTYYKLKLKQNS